jgi:hypothetical protein
VSDRLFAEVAARTPCYCLSKRDFDETGCCCSTLEQVCKAHIAGIAVEPLSDEQRAYIIQDTNRSDPGPWDSADATTSDRDGEVCSDWWSALRNYVESM